MDKKNLTAALSIALALICAGGWFHEREKLAETKRTFVADTLDPVSEMLKENAAISHELEDADYPEPGVGFIAAYLIKIRRDGLPKHSDMKQRIDRMNNNNTAILALLAKYSTHAKAPAFKASVERFRDYAISLRDRWQSVPEIFMAGGNLPIGAQILPPGFARIVDSEREASR
jgi:hypothetical protein